MVYLQNQKSHFWLFFEGIRMENVDIFYGHLEYFTEIWVILWTFGTFCVDLVHLFRFWYHVRIKIWQPWFGVFTMELDFNDSFE
jgi:hypothetical protein